MGKQTQQRRQLTDRELYNFIAKCRETFMPWAEIAEKVEAMGHRSERGGQPLAAATIRHRFHNPGRIRDMIPASKAQVYQLPASKEDGGQIKEMIRATLRMTLNDKQKLQLIQQLIEQE